MSNYDKNQIVELSDEAMEAVAGGFVQVAEANAASVVAGSQNQTNTAAVAANIFKSNVGKFDEVIDQTNAVVVDVVD